MALVSFKNASDMLIPKRRVLAVVHVISFKIVLDWSMSKRRADARCLCDQFQECFRNVNPKKNAVDSCPCNKL